MGNWWEGVSDFIFPPVYAEQISPNFQREEFNQKRKGTQLPIEQVKVDQALVDKLEVFRNLIRNRPIEIVSGYRSPVYNAMIGGAKKSQHMEGRAADIRIKGLTAAQVNKLALQSGLFGYVEPNSLTPSWTHVDVRGGAMGNIPMNYFKKKKIKK